MTARAWAARQQPGTPLRWKELEAAAWAAHPTVHRRLVPGSIRVPSGVQVAVGLLAVGVLVAWLYPVAGYAVAAGGRTGDAGSPATRVHVSGWIFAGGVVMHAVALLLWAATSRRREHLFQLQGVVALVLGALTLAQYAGLADRVAHTGRWTVVVVASMLLGALTLAVHARAPRPVRNTEPRVAVRAAIAELHDDERAAVRRDLGSALDDLHRRGVITDAEHERASTADLGMLTIGVSTKAR